VGGIELCLTRVNPAGWTFPLDDFRAVSVVRGEGVVAMAGVEQTVRQHHHFGIPAGIRATMRQTGAAPLVLLDATLHGHEGVGVGTGRSAPREWRSSKPIATART
jgi:hypothetical protein